MTLTNNEIDALNKSVTLYFKQGSSDKVYHASLEARDAGFVVNFAYGRRGSTLTSGTKTSNPIEYDSAVNVYEKLVKEKTAKGYTAGQDGTPYQHSHNEVRTTAILPQLLNAIEETELDTFLKDDRWWMQEKFDGKRVLIRKDGDQVTGINRNGLAIDLPLPIVCAVQRLDTKICLLDGEAVGDVYHAFDLLEEAAVDLRSQPFDERYAFLVELIATTTADNLRSAPTAIGTYAKQAMLDNLRRKEGVVLKDRNAPYLPGRPATGGSQLKVKFYATASCLVARRNGTKRSVGLDLFKDRHRVGVGNVTIPANHDMPMKGSVVEVRYLYAYPGGALFQPVYRGVRDDVDPDACTISQLKFKA